MRFINTTIIALALIFTACEGEEGPQGQQGPQGETGETGETGEPFQTHKLDFSVSGSDWNQQGDFNDPNFHFSYEHEWEILDGSSFNDYVLMGYINAGSGYFNLPYTLTYSNYFTTVSFGWRSGHVFVKWKDSDLQTIPPGSGIDFRFIALEINQYIEGMEELPLEEIQDMLN